MACLPLQLVEISGFAMRIENETGQNKAENPKPKDRTPSDFS